jgi:hypothetical protein
MSHRSRSSPPIAVKVTMAASVNMVSGYCRLVQPPTQLADLLGVLGLAQGWSYQIVSHAGEETDCSY